METPDKPGMGITINVNGGNVQILPNATHVVQTNNYYGCATAPVEAAVDEGQQQQPMAADGGECLLRYVADPARAAAYVRKLRGCTTAAAVGDVVAEMADDDEVILDATRAVKESFIKELLPLIPGVVTGRSIDNLRVYINEALARRRRQNRR